MNKEKIPYLAHLKFAIPYLASFFKSFLFGPLNSVSPFSGLSVSLSGNTVTSKVKKGHFTHVKNIPYLANLKLAIPSLAFF